MKLLKAYVENFGSYQKLEYSFHDQGLTLIHGATGSGKSTLQDIPTWILFGVTAKDGNVDDIRSWSSPGDLTIGILELEIGGKHLTVHRCRGKPSHNDLYWFIGDDPTQYRGKDITDSQKLLNGILGGLDAYLYMLAAYYNEFSPAGSFFTSKASDRRLLCQNLANLSLPNLLTERIADTKKEERKNHTQILERFNKGSGRLEQLKRHKTNSERGAKSWSEDQERLIQELEIKEKTFEDSKKVRLESAGLRAEVFERNRNSRIEKLKADQEKKLAKFVKAVSCEACGAIKSKDEQDLLDLNDEYKELIERETNALNPHIKEQEDILASENHYKEQADKERAKISPFMAQLEQLVKEIDALTIEQEATQAELDQSLVKSDSLVQLQKLVDTLRGELLKKTATSLESEVNRYMETYFDSEIRVQFQMDADKLEVQVLKSGYECSYKQLSKGQRSLLKLTFSLAAMKAASNKAGIHFDCLMMDEALDGMDTNLKLKAFNLFSELSLHHASILVIDHNEELQTMFHNKSLVTINQEGYSAIKES